MIAISDLPLSRALDVRAMSSLRGGIGSGLWTVGAFRPFVEPVASQPSAVNFFEITNNTTFIGQVVNNFTVFDVNNSGNNSTVTALLIGNAQGG
jgi:hypothetical protein